MKAITKTSIGYLKTLIGKYTPIPVGKDYLDGIYNYRKYNDYLSTSGQPTEDQFKLVKQAVPIDHLSYHEAMELSHLHRKELGYSRFSVF